MPARPQSEDITEQIHATNSTRGHGLWLVVACLALVLAACGGGGGASSPASAPPANAPPTAVLGGAQTVGVGATVSLDGSASTDPNNDPLTYAWVLTTKPTGSSAALTNSSTARPSFVADIPGTYVASLIVSDGKVNSAAASVSITSSWILKSFAIADPSAYYKDQCDFPSIQFVIPVRLNEDALMDFIVHYWCSSPLPWGREITTPTPDALVALVSQSDGTYKVANEQVFGNRLYRLGGASRKLVRGDINGDGKDDFAFAMNWEDGRSGARPETNATESSVLLSTPEGGYRVTRLGKANWNHAVEIVRNPNSVDVVFAGFVGPLQAFRHQSGSFSEVSAEYRSDSSGNWASSFRAIPDPATGVVQQIAGVASRQVPNSTEYAMSEWGIKLFSKSSLVWTAVREFWTKVEFTVKWISWQLTQGTNSVISVDGKQYFGGAYDEMCVMPALVKGGPQLLVAKMGAAQDTRGRTLVAGGTYSEQEAAPVNFFNFFDPTPGADFKPRPSPVVNEEINSNFNFFDCKDINSDGLPDLVSYAFTRPGFKERVAERGKPTVYLNNGKGQLVRIDLTALPGHSAGNELQGRLVDVNGDGIVDLMLFGSATDRGGGSIEVHLLRGQLKLP